MLADDVQQRYTEAVKPWRRVVYSRTSRHIMGPSFDCQTESAHGTVQSAFRYAEQDFDDAWETPVWISDGERLWQPIPGKRWALTPH